MAIPPPKSGGPTESQPGRVLLSDYIPTPGETAPVFQLDADPKEVDALGSEREEPGCLRFKPVCRRTGSMIPCGVDGENRGRA